MIAEDPNEIVKLLIDGIPFTCPRFHVPYARSIFNGRYACYGTPLVTGVRRVLDIGAGCGAFARFAAVQWPGCWITCFERDAEMRACLVENVPPGTCIIDVVPDWDEFDVVRVAIDVKPQVSPTKLIIHDYQERT